MLDCPPARKTSPTTTSATVTAFVAPRIVIPAGVASAAKTGRWSLHWPCASAVPETDAPLNSTTTFSPGLALPQTGTGFPRGITSPSWNSVAPTAWRG